jgi:hypothetical protein
MAYKQSGNPFKKNGNGNGNGNGGGSKTIQEKYEAWKEKKEAARQERISSGKQMGIKEKLDRKYGLGEYSREGGKFKERMKPGESKFHYDMRMRKLEREASKKMHDPDLDKIPTGVDATPWGDIPEEQQTVSTNPNDLRLSLEAEFNFGITDDMSFNEAFQQANIEGAGSGDIFQWRGKPYKFEYKEGRKLNTGFFQGDPEKEDWGAMYRNPIPKKKK